MSAPNAERPEGPESPEGSQRTVSSQGGRRKIGLRFALLVVVGVASLAVLSGFGSLLSSVTRSGQSADVFTNAAELPDALLDSVTWLPDDEAVSEPISPLMRLDMTSSWIRAWSQLTVAAETGDTSGMEVYFSEAALEGVLAGAEQSAGRPVYQISHELQVTFLSADKQVLSLTATKSRFIRAEPFDDDRRRFFETDESYEAVMVLEDGNWRIHHWVRRSVDGRWLVDDTIPTTADVLTELGLDGRPIDLLVENGLVENGLVDKGLAEGESADPVSSLPFADESVPPVSPELSQRIDVAFDAWEAASDGSKVVRFPIASSEASVNGTVLEVLDVAEDRGLSVIIAPFDGETEFSPSRWNSDRVHLESLRAAVTGHPAFVSIELSGSPGAQSDLADAWQVSLSGPSISVSDE